MTIQEQIDKLLEWRFNIITRNLEGKPSILKIETIDRRLTKLTKGSD